LCVEVDVYYKESKSTNKVSPPESISSGKYLLRKVSPPESISSGKYLQQIYFSIKILKIYLCLEYIFLRKVFKSEIKISDAMMTS